MSLAQILQQTGVITSMARELGVDEQTARMGAGALLPAIVAGMGRSSSGGAASDPLGGLGALAGAQADHPHRGRWHADAPGSILAGHARAPTRGCTRARVRDRNRRPCAAARGGAAA